MSVTSGPGQPWSQTNFTVLIDGVELGCRDVRGLGSTSALAPAPAGTVATAPAGPEAGTQAGDPPALMAGWAPPGALPGIPQPPLTAGGLPARLEWVLTPIVLSRGLDGNRLLYDWRANIVAGLADAREVVISLLDGAGGVPVQVWALNHAWPWSWSGPEFDAVVRGPVCERVELVYERLQWLDNTQTGDA
jgi:hypothetical protein